MDVTLYKVNFSFNKIDPIIKANITLTSLKALTNGIGAFVKAQTTIP